MTDHRQSSFTLRPIAPPNFVGRDDETKEIFERARDEVPPMQNLDGPTKIGRTSMLKYLRAVSRDEVGQDLEVDRDRCIAPYLDLTFLPRREQSVRVEILEAIVDEIRKVVDTADLPVLPDSFDTPGAVGDVAAAMEQLTADLYSFLLLIDHAEYLLRPAEGEDPRRVWSDQAVETLGLLTEQVHGAAVLVALGATGPGKNLRAQGRRNAMLKSLDALSRILNRGNLRSVTLGALTDREVEEFVEHARIDTTDGRVRALSDDERAWIVEVAAGHPLVMQNAGIHLAEVGWQTTSVDQRAKLTTQLGEGLQGFLAGAFRRIGAVNLARAAELEGLAESGFGDIDPELAAGLAEEGLVRLVKGRSREVMMPSLGLRSALLRYLEGERQSAPPEPGARTRSPGAILALAESESEKTVRLTGGEHILMTVLLSAADGEVISRQKLKAALGPGTGDGQLNQRVSALRGKLEDGLGVKKVIDGVYGEGYRIVEPDRFDLQSLD